MVIDINKLKEVRDNLLLESQFWNRNRLFLVWAFCAAILLTTGVEIMKYFGEGYYILGVVFLFILSLIIIWRLTKTITNKSDDINKTYKMIDDIIKDSENKK